MSAEIPLHKPLSELDEAQTRVMYRNFLKNKGRIGLLQCIATMQQCTQIALEVLKENW